MTTSTNSDTELLTEHFGYPPVSLIDDIINSVNILAERALNSIEQGLLNVSPSVLGFKAAPSQSQARDAPPPAEAAKAEIEAGTHQLETLLYASIDRNFDKFEIYVLRNLLCVRPADVRDWIRLSHYEGLDFSAAAAASTATVDGQQQRIQIQSDANKPSLDRINHLRRKLRESMRLNALLTAERARNERLLEELGALVGTGPSSRVKNEASVTPDRSGSTPSAPQSQTTQPPPQTTTKSPLAFLHNKGPLSSSGAPDALSTNTAFTLSQLQALRALSTSLSRIAPDLVRAPPSQPPPPSGADADMDPDGSNRKKSWRRERLEYVEGETRRHLEAVQGLELGRLGEVRDGEWQGPGRNLGRGEVERLERVIAVLGDGDGDGGGEAASSAAAAPGDPMDEDE
ncbi:Mis12 protein-domain-containing protein [Xylariaceae sp. FL0662B]|nr:Mis12 protein-domain-containing protein [Xylariaceae sp. FL0662B]